MYNNLIVSDITVISFLAEIIYIYIRWPTGIRTQTNCHGTNKYSDGTNKLFMARTNI